MWPKMMSLGWKSTAASFGSSVRYADKAHLEGLSSNGRFSNAAIAAKNSSGGKETFAAVVKMKAYR